MTCGERILSIALCEWMFDAMNAAELCCLAECKPTPPFFTGRKAWIFASISNGCPKTWENVVNLRESNCLYEGRS